ncbi:type II CAAX prenyl endopeptidase Rce1 family protein [Riemerella anatipestifer]|uniref:CPBP family glutamic-type intramembrane protease n=1 Tax=Riemerella anatipestifer TaxID=34085 RepID=UPI0023643343|nr:CPBP family glutamic-type intramembrane protease [Riemerella anatipestifer]MDD1539444.1 CPBP family intramembrane metalloprotease [Riemerella anatipestifer]
MFKSLSILQFYLVIIPLSLFIVYIWSYFLEVYGTDISGENPVDTLPREIVFFLTIIFAPIVETLVYQYTPYKLLRYFDFFKLKGNNRIYLLLFSSSIFFALSHPYSVTYIIYSFFVGLLFMYIFYYSYTIRKDGAYAFWLLVLIHMIINTLAFYEI